jgi:murein DD-endopeptidase MepM/ murein hydrolase activator NlpD
MRSPSIAARLGRTSWKPRFAVLLISLGIGCSGDARTLQRGSTEGGQKAVAQIARATNTVTSAAESPETKASTDTSGPSQTDEHSSTGPNQGPFEGTIEAGDSLSRVLHRAGLDAREIHEVTVALSAVMDPEKVREGQTYSLTPGEDGSLDAFTLSLSPVIEVRVEPNEQDQLEAKKIERETEIHVEEVGGTIEQSLWASLTAGGEHASLVGLFVNVFEYDINFFTDTRAGDAFKLIVEKELVDGTFVGYRHLLAAEYAGKAGAYRAFWWDPKKKGRGRYVDDQGRGIARTLLKTPLQFTRVSSKFDRRRMHPVLHRVKGHYGVDYAAPTGTPVRAAAAGTIVVRERRKGAGNIVIINHAHGMKTVYMHLDRFRRGQEVGQRVEQKTVIGYVGSTGLSTGPHLHFGVKIGGRYVDPLKVKMKRGPGVSRQHRARFKRHVAELGKRLEAIPSG